MAIEDNFDGAKNAYTYYFAYLNTVAQEIGMEKAVDLQSKMCESMGSTGGKIIKKQAGIEDFDAKAAASLAEEYIRAIGISSEVIDESPQAVSFKVGRCPLYEAAQVLGLDAESIETLCRTGAVRSMDSLVKQLNPNLNYQLRNFRSEAENFCEEAIVLG